MRKEYELAMLLEKLFATPERLQRFLYSLPTGSYTTPRLSDESSIKDVAFEAVDELRRRGMIDADFFERLIEENPGEMTQIREQKKQWLIDVEDWVKVPDSVQPRKGRTGAPSVLVSYARRDNDFFEELATHLKVLQRKGKIEFLQEGRIRAGDEWDETIKRQIQQASIFILLVSPAFLSSDFIWESEFPEMLERHEQGMAVIIPVIVRPCTWKETPIRSLQVLPSGGKPVSLSPNPDRVWTTVAKTIEKAVLQLEAQR
jgi:hypothetical protein